MLFRGSRVSSEVCKRRGEILMRPERDARPPERLSSSLPVSGSLFEGKSASALREELQREYLGQILTRLGEGSKPPSSVSPQG